MINTKIHRRANHRKNQGAWATFGLSKLRFRPLLLALFFVAFLISATVIHPQAKANAAGQTYTFTGTGANAAINATGYPTPPAVQFTSQDGGQTYTALEVCPTTTNAIMTFTISAIGAQTGTTSSATITTTVKSALLLGTGVAAACPGWPTPNGTISISGTNPNPNGNGNPANAANAPPSCESQGGSLAWILCGIFNTVSDMVQWMITNIIQPFLVTAPVSTDPTSASYQIWSNFRVYGDVFLVFALLVIVFGQSIGGGVVDAYTAKKVLPRLLIAAILINLSLYIVAFLVDVTNVVGQGVGNLLTEPLRGCAANSGGSCWNFTLSTTQIAGVFGVGIIGLLAGGVGGLTAIAALGSLPGAGAGIVALFFVMLPMVLALIAVFVTLVIRKGIILILLLISPVAFALYCLPNTEKYFRKWWDALLETLMVYPIVMAVFAVASLLSVTILQGANITTQNMTDQNFFSNKASPILAVIIAFVAQFLPLFIIPFAFRLAGGLLGRVHEFSTNAGNRVKQSGWYDRNRKDSQRKWQQQHVGAKRDMFTALNNRGIANVPGIGTKYIKNRSQRYEQQARTMGLDFMKDPHMQAIQYDGDALIAATYANRQAAMAGLVKDHGLSEEEAKGAVSRFEGTGMGYGSASAISAFHAAIQDGTTFMGGSRTVQARDENGRAIARTPGSLTQAEINRGVGIDANGFQTQQQDFTATQQMIETAARVGGTNESTRAALVGFANTATKGVGRHDMASGYGRLKTLVDGVAAGGAMAPTSEDYDVAITEAMRGASNPTLASNKEKSIEMGGGAMARQLQRNDDIIGNRELAETATTRHNQQLVARGQANQQITVEQYVANAQRSNAEITQKVTNMESAGLYASEAVSTRLQHEVKGDVTQLPSINDIPGGGVLQDSRPVQVMDRTREGVRPVMTTESVPQPDGSTVERQVPAQDPDTRKVIYRDRQTAEQAEIYRRNDGTQARQPYRGDDPNGSGTPGS